MFLARRQATRSFNCSLIRADARLPSMTLAFIFLNLRPCNGY
ncbi:Uncharacterised protein [Bordetella pertussis]|nr:Uncharacterised protein [Bordetella pertussis]CFP67201.1 Uncharacterised protein [Bordetella pertussis]